MRNLLFVTLAAIVISAMAVACGAGADSNPSEVSDKAASTTNRGDSTALDSVGQDSLDSTNNDTLGVATPMDEQFENSKRKALLICVGNYPQGSGWATISSKNDKDLLEPTLQELGFYVIERTESKATHANIKATFNEFINKCRGGDTVIVHFSGHGQRMVDQYGDEKDTLSECFVPYDALRECSEDLNGYRGQNHLTDDEIYDFISTIRHKLGKDGYLLVSFDACYSGGSSRGGSTTNIRKTRGTDEIFGEDILKRAKIKPHSQAGTVYSQFVAISACQPDEKNYEVNKQGKDGKYRYYGALSYILNEKLLEVKNGKLSLDKIATAIKADTNYWIDQTPYIDNKNDDTVQ